MKIKILCFINMFCSMVVFGMHQQHLIHSLALKLVTEKFTIGSIVYVPNNNETIKHVLKNFIFTIKKMQMHDPTLEIAVHSPESEQLLQSLVCPLLPYTVSSASFVYNGQPFSVSLTPIVLETKPKSPTPY